MEKVKLFFWYCAGANTQLLKSANSDSEKYVGIGAAVFFTGLFAAMAASYALFTVFNSVWIAIGFGLLWGLMIFNLDRYIVSSMRKLSNRWSELWMATPRILLAILISIVIAKPLELKIFEKEINAELEVMTRENFSEEEAIINSKYQIEKDRVQMAIVNLKSELDLKTVQRDKLLQIAQKESDGTGGSGRRNAGPIYKIKKADADKIDSELLELKSQNEVIIGNYYKDLNKIDSSNQAELSLLKRMDIGGPAARMEAISRLSASSNTIWWSNFFIILLFIVIETAPIFVKLISNKGPYDYLLETEEYRYETAHLKDIAFIHSEIKKETEALSSKEKEFVIEKLDIKLEGI